ncbi:hypothetical protein ABTL72_19670, partial [Acinetobacter baumannii]
MVLESGGDVPGTRGGSPEEDLKLATARAKPLALQKNVVVLLLVVLNVGLEGVHLRKSGTKRVPLARN